MKVICDISVTSAPMRSWSWSPAALFAGGALGAWYDPSNLSSLFQDLAMTIPVTLTGQTVAVMLDSSGNAKHLTQPNVAQRPTYRSNGSVRWLEFDGVDDRFVFNAMSYSQPSLGAVLGVAYATPSTSVGVLRGVNNTSPSCFAGYSLEISTGEVNTNAGNPVLMVDGAAAPNDRKALRAMLNSPVVFSGVNISTAQLTGRIMSTYGYLTFAAPAGKFYGYIEKELMDTEVEALARQWLSKKME